MLGSFYFAGFILCLLGFVLCCLGDGRVTYYIIWEDDDEQLIDPIYRAKLLPEKESK